MWPQDTDLSRKRSRRYLTGIYAFFIIVFAITLSLFYKSWHQNSTLSEKQATDILKLEDSSDNLQIVKKKIEIFKGQPENKYAVSKSNDEVNDENIDTALSKKGDFDDQKINTNGSKTLPEEIINPSANVIRSQPPLNSSDQNSIIYFSAESTGLTDKALEKLKTSYLFLLNAPDEEIIIEGYGDSSKTNRNNKNLSKIRSNVVKDYFIKRGISNSRIKTYWMGSENITGGKVSEKDKAKTHQVEIKFKYRSKE